MAFSSSPAASSEGTGTIHLALLPPGTPRLRSLVYQYPLKLVSPTPLWTETEPHTLVHTVYLLTYGGGLVAGDAIHLQVTIDKITRLILLTQGSTKIFKSPSRELSSKQRMSVDLAPGSALCYLPDPVQPFERSLFAQHQVYNIAQSADGLTNGSLCVLDWVSNGRPANGEDWSFYRYGSKNEIYLHPSAGSAPLLLLRDNMLLDDGKVEGSVAACMDGLAVCGTLMLYGPLFKELGQFFMDEFRALPRIGGRKWDTNSDSGNEDDLDVALVWRAERQRQESSDGLLWSAASVRGCVVVKFGAKQVEHGRRWLTSMLSEEGSVLREFGERALLCLR